MSLKFKLSEVRQFMKCNLDSARMRELTAEMREAGLPMMSGGLPIAPRKRAVEERQ